MAKSSSKKGKNYRIYLALVLIVCIVAFVIFLQNKNLENAYKLELYVKKPDQSVVKVYECQSSSEYFDCTYNFKDCSEEGQYYGRALTITGDVILSDSGWKPFYAC